MDLVLRRGGPLITRLEDEAHAERFRLSYPLALVATLADETGLAMRTVEGVCQAIAEVRCGLLASAASSPPGRARTSSLTMYRATDDARIPYVGDLEGDHQLEGIRHAGAMARLRKFVMANQLQPVVRYGPETRLSIFGSDMNLLVLHLHRSAAGDLPGDLPTPPPPSYPSSNADRSPSGEPRTDVEWGAAFAQAAVGLHGEAIFVAVDVGERSSQPLRSFLGLGDVPLPAVALYDKSSHAIYHLPAVGAVRAVRVEAATGEPSEPAVASTVEQLAAELTSFVRSVIDRTVAPLPLPDVPLAAAQAHAVRMHVHRFISIYVHSSIRIYAHRSMGLCMDRSIGMHVDRSMSMHMHRSTGLLRTPQGSRRLQCCPQARPPSKLRSLSTCPASLAPTSTKRCSIWTRRARASALRPSGRGGARTMRMRLACARVWHVHVSTAVCHAHGTLVRQRCTQIHPTMCMCVCASAPRPRPRAQCAHMHACTRPYAQ